MTFSDWVGVCVLSFIGLSLAYTMGLAIGQYLGAKEEQDKAAQAGVGRWVGETFVYGPKQ